MLHLRAFSSKAPNAHYIEEGENKVGRTVPQKGTTLPQIRELSPGGFYSLVEVTVTILFFKAFSIKVVIPADFVQCSRLLISFSYKSVEFIEVFLGIFDRRGDSLDVWKFLWQDIGSGFDRVPS